MLENIKVEMLAVKQSRDGNCLGRQKQSLGRVDNSPSGVGFLLGGYTQKVLCLSVFSKICRVCSLAKKKD
jgi:hypothetical protein